MYTLPAANGELAAPAGDLRQHLGRGPASARMIGSKGKAQWSHDAFLDEFVVVESIEEFFQIHVHHISLSVSQMDSEHT